MSDPTPKMTKIQIIQLFLQERGQNWDLADYQIENPDRTDGKITLARITPGCECETRKKRGSGVRIDPNKGKTPSAGNIVDDEFILTEKITIEIERTKKGKDEFVMTHETPICSYKRTTYNDKETITYVQEDGKTFPIEKIVTSREAVGDPEAMTCPADKMTFTPASINRTSYGVILAACGEDGPPEEFTTTHRQLIDSLKALLDGAER